MAAGEVRFNREGKYTAGRDIEGRAPYKKHPAQFLWLYLWKTEN